MLAFGATGAVAQVTATYDAQDGAITVAGLDQAPEAVVLRVAGLKATQSMPVTVTARAEELALTDWVNLTNLFDSVFTGLADGLQPTWCQLLPSV